MGVTLKNSGKRAGDEGVLVYINEKVSSVTTAVKKLVAFRRINLGSGVSKDLSFLIPNESFKIYDKEMNYGRESGEFEIIIGNRELLKTVVFDK